MCEREREKKRERGTKWRSMGSKKAHARAAVNPLWLLKVKESEYFFELVEKCTPD